MEEILVARPGGSTILLVSLTTGFLFITPTAATLGWPGAFVGLLLMTGFVLRFSRMRVSVTATSVEVVNFLNRQEVSLDSIRIVDRRDQPLRVSDAGGKFDTDGRTLFLTDATGKEAQIELAPLYGSRLDEIAENLYEAIAIMQSRD